MDNTPAFPTYERFSGGAGPLDLSCQGMSLRDYFAAKALQGLLADHEINAADAAIAKAAYVLADAMMAARGQQ